MALEDVLDKIGKRKIYSFFLGILYVLVSYGTAKIFFPGQISIVVIFFITLLLIPSAAKLISLEEKIERRDGLHHFFKDHAVLMEIFLFLFLGISIGYLLVGSYAPEAIEYQNTFLAQQQIDFGIDETVNKGAQLSAILINNIGVIVIAFVLSLFYGVGALFLIVLNASVFASFILKVSALVVKNTISTAAVLSLHFVPEVFGFLLAAMAGGVISKAISQEKIGTTPFRNVVKDGTVLLGLAVLLIVIGALIEVFVTPVTVSALL